jgi:hypothetical protein
MSILVVWCWHLGAPSSKASCEEETPPPYRHHIAHDRTDSTELKSKSKKQKTTAIAKSPKKKKRKKKKQLKSKRGK